MRLPPLRRLSLALPFLLAACADEPGGQCIMREVANLTVLNNRGAPVVRVGVDGKPAAFVVDTGASVSMVTPEAVDRFGLSVDPSRSGMIGGVGGSIFTYPATVERMDLGTAAAREVTLLVSSSFTHAVIDGLPLSGLFGADFVANYDAEFDLPAHHVSLYREQGCGRDFAQPWQGLAYRENFDLERQNAIMLDAKLDGRPTRMQLDSGATGTIIDLDTAAAAGATRAAREGDRKVTSRGIDGNRLDTWIHQFASLEIGPDRLGNPWVAVADIQSNNLLGANFLRTHRVWISYPHELIWVQPVGQVHLVEPQAVSVAPPGTHS